MHYDIEVGGTGQLNYSNPLSRYIWVFIQLMLWVAVVVAIVKPNWRRRQTRKKYDLPEIPPVVSLSGNGAETVQS
jgi:hypothetical protein